MSGVTLSREGEVLEVKIEGRWSEIADAKEKVKEIPGRRWNPDKKVWVLPADPELADQILKTLRPTADEELMAWLKQSMVDTEESLTSPLPEDGKLLIPWGHERAPWSTGSIQKSGFVPPPLNIITSQPRHMCPQGQHWRSPIRGADARSTPASFCGGLLP